MNKIISILVVVLSCTTAFAQSGEDFFVEYETTVRADRKPSIVKLVDDMVMKDTMNLSKSHLFYRHSKMVFSKRVVKNTTRKILAPQQPKVKYEHKPHIFKDRGFGNTNHNAPGHVCDETCHNK